MKANSNFLRGALAVAVATSCGYAAASTISIGGGAHVVTGARVAEAVAGTGVLNTANKNVVVTLGAQYSASGRVTLTLTNGSFSGTPTSATCSSVADQSMSLSRESGGAAGSTTVTYLVTGVSAGQDTNGDICTFEGVGLQIATLSGDTKVEFTAKNNLNADIDNTAIGSAIIASVRDQFAFVSKTDLNGIIDVENAQLRFTTVSEAGTPDVAGAADARAQGSDALSFFVRSVSVSAINSAAQGTFETTIGGDFSFIKSASEAGTCSAGNATTGDGRIAMTVAGIATSGFSVTVADGCQSLLVKLQPVALQAAAAHTTAGIGSTIAFYKTTASADGTPFAPVASFTTSGSRFGYGAVSSAREQTVTIGSVGSWTTNGTTIDVPYMPFGTTSPAISHVITLNNRATTGGAVRVSAWRAAGTYGGVAQTAVACASQNVNIGDIAAGESKNITTAVTNYVQQTCGWGTGQTRVALRFSVATPAASTELYSSFTVDGTRSNVVPNSSNGRGATTR